MTLPPFRHLSREELSSNQVGFIHPARRHLKCLVATRPGSSFALLVPLGHPLGRAEGAVVLSVLLALLGILALLRLAPTGREKKNVEENTREGRVLSGQRKAVWQMKTNENRVKGFDEPWSYAAR